MNDDGIDGQLADYWGQIEALQARVAELEKFPQEMLSNEIFSTDQWTPFNALDEWECQICNQTASEHSTIIHDPACLATILQAALTNQSGGNEEVDDE